jgi:nucleoside-diphosphate-sugar epimerase
LRKVLVTGGLGFIGCHVVDALLAKGDAVQVVDSLVTAVTDGREYDAHPRCVVNRCSVEEYFGAGALAPETDWVVHAAACVGPAEILRYQGRLGGEIVRATQLVVDSCLAADVALAGVSSAEVYGRSGLLAEGDALVVPTAYNARLEYALAKALGEAMILNSRRHGLRGIVLRPFNVAGARQSRAGGFVVPTFVQQALAGKPLTVFAGGRQVRAFLSAWDFARFITDHLDAAIGSELPIFNLGHPDNATTIWSLAERVVERVGSASPVVHADARAIHGPDYHEAESIEKLPVLGAASAVGWQPRADLDALIDETADHYRSHPDARAPDAPGASVDAAA